MSNVLDFSSHHLRSADFIRPEPAKIPIVTQALFILQESEGKGIKLTATNRLGRALVQKFWNEHVRPNERRSFKPYKQDDCPEITKVFFLLSELGFVRASRGRVRLSIEGKSVLESTQIGTLYESMLRIYINAWNWACEDRYPEFEFIQENAMELIFSLTAWSAQEVSPRELFDDNFVAREKIIFPREFVYKTPEEYATHCLRTRFFNRFAVPFGLLEDRTGDQFDPSINKIYYKTALLGCFAGI